MIERNIKIGKTNLFYKKYYSKENIYTILILHGWGGSSDSWTKTGELLLENGYNVIIPDLPGFGKTKINKTYNLDLYAKFIENFIELLSIDKLILWGHSNGGAISIKLASREILKIDRLILNNSAGIRNDKKRSYKRKILNKISKLIKKCFFNKKLNISNYSFYKKIREIFYKMIGSGDYINSENNIYLKDTYKNMISSDLSTEISKINLNSLLIRGEKDTYTPVGDGNKIRKLIKNSKLIILENQKHGIHFSNPELLVNTFLNNI